MASVVADTGGLGLSRGRWSNLPAMLPPDAPYALVVDVPPPVLEALGLLLVAPLGIVSLELGQLLDQVLFVVSNNGLVTSGGADDTKNQTYATLRSLELVLNVKDGLPLTSGAQYFPSRASLRMSLSRLKSATNFLRRAFSFSSSLRRLTSSVPMEPY